ncbi:hypothetical protein PFISCL1PPCAC_10862, partial [Pristionchus fissidentatus]
VLFLLLSFLHSLEGVCAFFLYSSLHLSPSLGNEIIENRHSSHSFDASAPEFYPSSDSECNFSRSPSPYADWVYIPSEPSTQKCHIFNEDSPEFYPSSDSGVESESDVSLSNGLGLLPLTFLFDFSESTPDIAQEEIEDEYQIEWLSSTSYLARFRPSHLREYHLLPSIDESFLSSFSFFCLTRPINSPSELSEEELMDYMAIQMKNLWGIQEKESTQC